METIPVKNVPAQRPPVHVASFIVHARPEVGADVANWLTSQPGVEIHTQNSQAKFAVVIECDHEKAVLDIIDRVIEQPGVLNAALIYHEIIDAEEDD